MGVDGPTHASGLKTIMLRSLWEASHDETLKRQLVRYNLEDCMALKQVAELVYRMSEELTGEKTQPEIALEGHVIGRAEDINTLVFHGKSMAKRRSSSLTSSILTPVPTLTINERSSSSVRGFGSEIDI